MELKKKIYEDLKKALFEKKDTEVSVLRLLNSSILNKEKEKRYKISLKKDNVADLDKASVLGDEEILEVIISEVKKRKEAIIEFEKGNRKDLADKEKKELEILKRYLPEQLSEEEIKELAKEAIKKVGAKEIKDMGKVMSQLMPKVKGRADGSLVSKIVKELLSSNSF
jgi:uncharacterized protein YqeY